MDRRVLYFDIHPIHTKPPCLAQVCTLRDMGIHVELLTTGCNGPARKLLEEKGIPIHLFSMKELPVMVLQRAVNGVNYYRVFRRFFGQYQTDNTVLWIGSEQSAIKMWRFLKGRCPTIVNCLEFYENQWYQEGMPSIARQADILTACEPHRAAYMVSWWGLDRQPYLLRNKPYGPIPPKGQGSTPELRQGIDLLRGKKVLLYQGAIAADRDLSSLARALKDGGGTFYLALSGPRKDDGVERLKAIYDKVLYLGNYPAPTHLEITPYATACVAFYEDNCINNRYCAPNKIYEYAGCGAPMLCNPIPGLTETVGRAGAAECVDFSDAQAVNQALERICRDYPRYHQAALDFYRQTDNRPVMEQIVDYGFSLTKAAKA